MATENDDIPNEFICPITKKIMKDPFFMPDGYTYEKEAIELALTKYSFSPISSMKMEPNDGIPYSSLKEKIKKYVEEKNITIDDEIKCINFENLTIKEVQLQEQPVEFEELFATYILKDKSSNLCNDAVHVCMKPKKVEKTLPILLIFVVDVSGSMNSNCCSNIESLESVFISRLSLIKHSIKTIVSALRKEDMVSLIEFSNDSTVILKPTIVRNKIAKDFVIENVDSMTTTGMTNMWSGIKSAIDISKNVSYKNYQKSIMVFTDGMSNVNPTNGIINSLKDTLNETDDKFTISTFSYGNDAKPELLIDIANLCDGIYGYCPDATMVGTIFINYMANLLSTITPTVKVTLSNENEKNDENKNKTITVGPLYREVYQNAIFDIDQESLDKVKIKIELPMTNQTFEVPLNTESADLTTFINEMESLNKEEENNNKNKKKDDNKDDDDKDDDDNDDNDNDDDDEILDKDSDDEQDTILNIEEIDPNILIVEKDSDPIKYEEILYNQILRKRFISLVKNIINTENLEESKKNVTKFFELLNQLKYKNKFVKGLIIDIDHPDPNHGQIMKAIKEEYFNTWGKIYLCSFIRFHEFEQCGNFKDQSLQFYSHEVFSIYRKIANSLFINLPPPSTEENRRSHYTPIYQFRSSPPSRRQPRASFLSSFMGRFSKKAVRCSARLDAVCYESAPAETSEPPTRSLNSEHMKALLDRHGGCFNGDALVVLSNGQTKYVRDLTKGDRLNNNAIVQCVVEQSVNTSSQPFMCNIDGVLLTPYHPIKKDNSWYFPIDLCQAKPTFIKSWFNLILKDDNQHYEVEFQNGVKAITLGHYRTENDILKHPYFGTDAVLKDLKDRDPGGYENGYIYIKDFHPRQLQYDENNYCINYYKMTTINLPKSKLQNIIMTNELAC